MPIPTPEESAAALAEATGMELNAAMNAIQTPTVDENMTFEDLDAMLNDEVPSSMGMLEDDLDMIVQGQILTGVFAQTLRGRGATFRQLMNRGFLFSNLTNVFTAHEMRSAGEPVENLINAGMSEADIRQAYPPEEVSNAGL